MIIWLASFWCPLFAINIRLKSGESINAESTGNKSELDNSNKSVKGFKIDLRFIYDTDEDVHDVGAGESCRGVDGDKLSHDLGKVIRESKDVLDGLLNIVMDDKIAKSLSAWFIQICGLQAEVASLHLAFNGLYVAVPQKDLKFPTSIATMEDFLDTFSHMLLFVDNLELCAKEIQAAMDQLNKRRSSMGLLFNRDGPAIEGHNRSNWMRPTWYSPPRQDQSKSRLPPNLFGRENVDDEPDQATLVEEEGKEEEEGADMFGWMKRGDRWYNVYSKTFSDTHYAE